VIILWGVHDKTETNYAVILMLAKQRDQSVYRINITSKAVNLLYLLDGRNKSSLYCTVNTTNNSCRKKMKKK
jgi:hypothetical protein